MDLSGWIDRRADFAPDKPAICFEGESITYADLARRVSRLAALLQEDFGVGPGVRVAYLGFNNPEMIALLFACAHLGAILVPLNWRLATPEHRQMLEDCTPVVLFVEAPFVASIETLRGEPGCERLVAMDEAPEGWLSFKGLLARSRTAAHAEAAARGDAPVLICYTSGSTGKPKGVVLTQDALFWNAVNSTQMHDMTSNDRVLTTLPMFHVGGLNVQTLPALHAGATVFLHPKFDPDAVFDVIEQERITLTVLVPAQLSMLMEHPRWASADLSCLRMITSGSTLVPEVLIRPINERGVPLIQVYGSTETAPIAAYLSYRDAARKVGSTGKAAVHCELRLVDDLGQDVPQGVSGEITVRGPNVMVGYWNAPELTAAVMRDGWFHTGDVGHLDEDGFLFVDGRKKDMIITGGENVYPAELENILAECEYIQEATVVGCPDPRWGEAVVAVVVPKEGTGLDPSEVIDLFQGRLARYKHPREVVFVDRLPRTAVGKIRKEDVRKLVTDRAASSSDPSGAVTA